MQKGSRATRGSRSSSIHAYMAIPGSWLDDTVEGASRVHTLYMGSMIQRFFPYASFSVRESHRLCLGAIETPLTYHSRPSPCAQAPPLSCSDAPVMRPVIGWSRSSFWSIVDEDRRGPDFGMHGSETGTLRGQTHTRATTRRRLCIAVCLNRYHCFRRATLLRHTMPSPFFCLCAFAPTRVEGFPPHAV